MGSWVTDAGNLFQGTNFVGGQILRHAEFYRIVSVTPAANGTLALEVHRPVTRADGFTTQYSGMLVSIPSVTDVFERPLMTATTNP